MDDFEQDWADMMGGNYTMDEVAAGDDIQSPAAYDAFEQDWADVTGGRQMFDEVAAEVQPYIDSDTSAADWGPYTGLIGANYGGYTTGEAQDKSSSAYDKGYGTFGSTPGEAGLTALLKKLLGTNITDADVKKWAPLLAGLVSATGVGRAKVTPAGYTGMGSGQSLIPKYTATRTALAMPAPRAYGAAAQGQQYFSPTQFAAQGGILSLAEGGLAEKGFVIPADVVSHLGNGSSEAGLRMLAQQLGATPIKGEGDGMSDSIDTHIDGKRPAKVANDEAYMSPEKVAAIGGGDTGKGAQKLYAMMDKIRQARTGNKEQGKQIDAAKFLPGGKVPGYATDGVVAPANTTGISENLAGWAGDYVTGMLGQGQALANQPYQGYTGTLTAGTSPISQQAYGQAANFQVPGSVTQASNTLGALSGATAGGYSPTQFGSQFNAPGAYQGTNFTNTFTGPNVGADTQFSNQYQAPTTYNASQLENQYQGTGGYAAGQFTNQFQAPTVGAGTTQFTNQFASPLSAADTAGTQFDTGTFGASEAQRYMNPYLQQSLDPQLAEARRQSQITQLGNAAKSTQAGAFGGSRQALMDTETQRNLGSNLANITGQGYNTAYTNAMSQFNADQARQMQAQQATESSRQFGTGQKMSAAQLQAQYGMSAQQAQEAARQFNSGQTMTAAQLQAQYGLSAQQAQEASKQFGANLGVTQAQNAAQYGMSAAQLNAQQQQFGASQAATAAQLQAQYGMSAQQAQEAARQFNSGQKMTAAQLQAQYGLSAQQAQEASKQFGAQQGMTGAQSAAQYGLAGQQAQEQSKQFGANLGLQGLQQQIAAAQAQGNLGISSGQLGLQGISQLGQFGGQQQATEQAALDAQKAQFEAERDNPFKMVQFQQSLLQGLPLKAQDFTTAQTSALQEAIQGAGGVSALLKNLGYDV